MDAGFEQIIGEVRFLYDFLLHRTRTSAHYILPDKIMYDAHNVTMKYGAPEKINQVTFDHKLKGGAISLTFNKSDGSDLDLHLLIGYLDSFMNIRVFNDDTLNKCVGSLEAFSFLLILRCRSAFEEDTPIVLTLLNRMDTPEFYYMSKDLYGVEHVENLLQQFMDWGLPFPDYILKTAVDAGDLEYAAALVHEKDALQMNVKEGSLRL